MWRGRVRYRAVDEIIEEMRFVASHGLGFVFFTQDTLEEGFLRRLCVRLIEEGVGVNWGCYARLDELSEDTADLMARAGCRHVFVGFEAPEGQLRSFMTKEIDRERSISLAARFKRLGIMLIGSFVACFPGQTEKQLASTLDFAIECAVGLPLDRLHQRVQGMNPLELPALAEHMCVVNPMACIPGTDFHRKHHRHLRFVEASNNDEGCGSYLFGANDFVRAHWRVVSNGFCTVLPPEQFDRFYPLVRVFNHSVQRPYHLAWISVERGKTAFEVASEVVDEVGRDRVMYSSPDDFERAATAVLDSLL
jgi:hypothetical protein